MESAVKLLGLKVLPIALALGTTGCLTLNMPVNTPEVIPASNKQLIKPIQNRSINYTFSAKQDPGPLKFTQSSLGDTIVYNIEPVKAIQSLMNDLMTTKFSSVSDTAKDTVTFTIETVDAHTTQPFSIEIKALVEMQVDGKKTTKEIAYANKNIQNNHDFVMQYVIGADKAIDNAFETK